MPIYQYRCNDCKFTFEKTYCLKDYAKKPVPCCPECNSFRTKRVFLPGHGGIQCDDGVNVKWLDSAIQVMQPDYERPVQTRGEWKKYLKEHDLIAAG